ncbi:hypothetical protein ABER61_22420 [Brevibacillus formosus]|uniref:Uncharacterized protein n=1 Tax=Brevibacillus formosus TaxID=54913 RepID=A0A837KM09_9BACL|nr:hypothetical protein [Brevibacillus formosus]KLH97299.1 hypothetical protein AA984_22335 [Brevibacillus formosus]MED1957621.1 hypothetical protein [Brevibacillus formosus]PSJ94140.1 hypothetical protein C7R91_19215 [Brevibacillus formosus]GED58710.1 hypothetical protein BFO01nite_28420 [Brevibacillus formosus]
MKTRTPDFWLILRKSLSVPNIELKVKSYIWYYSENGTKRVRVMNKKGKNDALEANFETFKDPWQWEKEGNRKTNYHVEIK